MILKRTAAALIGAALALSLLSGCGSQTVSPLVSASPDAAQSASADDLASAAGTLNMAGAYESQSPDTVMMTVNGNSVLWEEYFCLIYIFVNQIQSQIGQITDWSETIVDDSSYEDYVLDSAVNYVLQEAAIRYGFEQLGVTLSDESQAEVQGIWDEQVEAAGGESDLIARLEEQYCTKDIYLKYIRASYLADACFEELYGEKGSNLSDEDVADYTLEDGYLMAKHILMLTKKTDESGNQVDMTNDEKAQVREKMEGFLDQLESYDGDNFDTYFDELMTTNSEDPGSISNPNGYLFQSGNMVPEFEDATKALEIGQFSDIVETNYGYHIIYRIPLNYDVVPSAPGSTDSLRYSTAYSMYDATVQVVWLNSLDVTYSDAYDALDFNKIFAVG